MFRGTIFTAILLFAIFSIGCEIDEMDKLVTGSVYVAAFDSSGTEVVGGKIFLDGVERGETTPDTLENIPLGIHTVKVKARGFEASELEVEVFKGEVASLEFTLQPAVPGNLMVTSMPAGASIIVDLKNTGELTPHLFTSIEAGDRVISVFIEGYKTLAPELITVTVDPEDTVSASFILQSGPLGSNVGNIAFDFTLEDDFGSMVSLHNYRGYIVLLTFFFSNCQPCMVEFPDIQAVYEEYATEGFRVLGIDTMWFGDELQDVIDETVAKLL